MASFSVQDSLIKFIFNDTALYELYFGRTLVAALLLIIFLKVTSQKLILKTHYPFLTTLRVICFFFGFIFFKYFIIPVRNKFFSENTVVLFFVIAVLLIKWHFFSLFFNFPDLFCDKVHTVTRFCLNVFYLHMLK